MAEERLRRNLESAFDPGPDFPHRLWLSRTMAMLAKEAASHDRNRRWSSLGSPHLSWLRPGMRLAALLTVVVVAVATTAVFLALHKFATPVPATPVPLPSTQVRQPIAITSPFAPDCSVPHNAYGCGMQTPVFATANVGWITAGYEGASGKTNLYRTDDGGRHWTAQVSWDGPGAYDIETSRNGKEALIVTGWGGDGPGLFHTTDGGSHWTSLGFPVSATRCMNTGGGTCGAGLQRVYFLNPQEGWVLAQEPTFDVAELFHTTDSGAHWALSARINVLTQFNRYVLLGHGLNGQLVFQSSSEGWFVPNFGIISASQLFIYRTRDGGVTWQLQNISTPQPANSPVSARLNLVFFDSRAGLLQLTIAERSYVSTTSDGGANWSQPIAIPIGGNCGFGGCPAVDFIDIDKWVGVGSGGLLHTTDGGQHWSASGTDSPGCCWLDFVDPSHGWTVAGADNGNALFVTTDGGTTWARVTLPTAYSALYPAG